VINISKISTKIKSIFDRKKKTDKNTLDINEIIKISFSITKSGALFVDGRWINNSEEVSVLLGNFLRLLTSGELDDNVNNYFGAIGNVNEELYLFAEIAYNIFNKDKHLDLLEEDEEEPLIKPSQAFAFNRDNTQNHVIKQNDSDEEDEMEVD